MNELDKLRKWVELVQKKNQWPHHSDWTNHQFQALSDDISNESGIKIDRNTIRKIVESVNNEKLYSPHISTKDALALYIGKKNWQQFVKSLKKPEKRKRGVQWLIFVAIAALLFTTLFYLSYKNTKENAFKFSITNPEGVIPHTVLCNYNIEKLNTEDIYIDYGHVDPDGNYKLLKISKNSFINNNCFHYPGDYNIRLLINGEVKFNHKVWINSQDWFIYAIDAASFISKHEIPNLLKEVGFPPLQYIPFNSVLEKESTEDGYFHIPEEKIMDIDGQTVNHHLHLKNFRPFGIEMENANFSICFRDNDFGNRIYCSEAAIYLHCEKGLVGFKFAQKGCERYTHQRIGGLFETGKDFKLNHLIIDYRSFRTISIKGTPNEIVLLLDGEVQKTFSTQQKFGEIRGLHFWFKGSPYIDFVRISNNKGTMVYTEEFD